jgi:repressor LexA
MKLSKRQAEILNFLKDFVSKRGMPPTLQETADHFSIKSPNGVRDHFKALEKKGFITRIPDCSRGILFRDSSFPDEGSNYEKTDFLNDSVSHIPLLGTIAAGTPLYAQENIEGFLPAASTFFGSSDLFSLRVKGDSLIEKHIETGDFVIIKRQSTAERGDIVAAIIDDDATLKIFIPEPDRVVLMPANSALYPIIIPRKEIYRLIIVGKLVGVIRKFGF